MAGFKIDSILNDKSKGESKGGFAISYIPIAQIVPNEKNAYNVDDVQQLAASIEMQGLQQNLVVRPLNDGRYQLISGHRRFKACTQLYAQGKAEFASLPCKIERNLNEIESELALLCANSTTRELTDGERLNQYTRMKELLTAMKKEGYPLKGRVRELVGEMLHLSSGQLARMNAVAANLTGEVRQKLTAGELSLSAAYELSKLPAAEQVQAANGKAEQSAQPAKKQPKRYGALVHRQGADRMDIRYDIDDYHGDLHCGDSLKVRINGGWVSTRLEYSSAWYLVGIKTQDICGLLVCLGE